MEYYVSQVKYDELQQELETLKREARQQIAEDLRRAKEFGDLSENAEYAEARQRQSLIESRIFELEELLKKANIIKKTEQTELVEVGSVVTVKRDGKTLTYSIVGSEESRPEENKISNESPLGKSFLGKRVGETAEIKTPSGMVTYKIISIA